MHNHATLLAGLRTLGADAVPAGQLPSASLYEFCFTPSSVGGGVGGWRAWRLDLPAYEPPADGLFRRILVPTVDTARCVGSAARMTVTQAPALI